MNSTIEILDRVVIVSGKEPRSRALAGVQLLANGDLLVGYRYGSDHLLTDDGAVITIRSSDGGRTWGEPRSVFALPGWDCAGGSRIVQTPSGDLIMFVFQARRADPETAESHVYPTSSTDYGHTWGPFGPELVLFRGWTESYAVGHVHVLSAASKAAPPNGRWMMPVHGADTVDGVTYSTVAFSDDAGQTWGDQAILARDPTINFYETAIIRLRDGRFLAVIRTQDPPFEAYQSYSADEGRTWTSPTPTGFQGHTPYLIELPSGAILCAYRERHPDRPGVSVSITHDDGGTWAYAGQLYAGTHWNCGYPSLVRLPSGDLFCVYYTSYTDGNCEIHGLFLAERD